MKNWEAKSIISGKQLSTVNLSHVPCAMRHVRGFTLIEMMVVVAIFTIVMGITFAALRLNENLGDLTFLKIQLYRQNKRAHDAILEELQKSRPSTLTIINNASPTPDEIRFQIPLPNSIDNATYAIPWGASYLAADYINGSICYKLAGTNLTREVRDSGGSVVNGTQETKAANIIDLQFFNVTADYIGMNTTTRRTTLPPQRQFNATLESRVSLLNR